jgi:hypothetical protein
MSFDLATLQIQLASLVRGQRPDGAGDYVQTVGASVGMEVMREIIASWRDLLLRRSCPLTAALLDHHGRLKGAIASLNRRSVPAFIDSMAAEFVSGFMADDDPLVAAAAQFEHAVLLARQGVPGRVTIAWPHDPEEVVHRLTSRIPLEGMVRGSFETVVTAGGG